MNTVSAGQQRNGQVAGVCDTVYGSDGLLGWLKSGQGIQHSPGHHALGPNAAGSGEASPIRLPAALLLAVSLGVVVRRLGVDRRWLQPMVLLVLDLGVPSGLLLRGARRRVTGWLAVGGGYSPFSWGSARSSTASRLADATNISLRSWGHNEGTSLREDARYDEKC
jgi:hypothetical protein